MKMFSSSVVLYGSSIFLFGALACGGPIFQEQTNQTENARRSLGSSGHGIWVTRMGDVLAADPNADNVLDLVRANHLTELYLSIGQGVISNPRLPSFIRGLKDREPGLAVQALIGDGGSVVSRIDSVIAYNNAGGGRPPGERFDGVHLDIEPWAGTGEDYSWVPGLIDTYRSARATVDGTGLTLAADIAGAKMFRIAPADQQSLVDAATRLVLMEYEVSPDMIYSRVDQFLSTVDLSASTFMVGTRVQDFGAGDCRNGAVLNAIEQRYTNPQAPAPGYAGWATFAYRDYINPAICPVDPDTGESCCAIP